MHPRVHWGELQPGSCTCSTVQRDREVDGNSQLHPVAPHCCFFGCILLVFTAENWPLRPFGAAATMESRNRAVTTIGPL